MACLIMLPQDCLLQILTSKLSVKDCLALGCACKYCSQLIKDDAIWKALSERKWGPWVCRLAHVGPGQWKAYAMHRINSESLPPSPLNLIQEQYPDPWQHLACCILCSRTTGGPVVRQAISSLLDALPTPSAVLDASKPTLMEMLHPLGLQAVRYSALREMSRDFLERDWSDPSEFLGCGKFTADSWRIFCRGHRSLRGVEDATLLRYLRWLTKGTLEEKKPRAKPTGGNKQKHAAPFKGGEERLSDVRRWLRSQGASQPGQTPGGSDRRVTRSATKKG